MREVDLAIARSRKKLREAAFFLARMRDEDRSRSDSEIFGYYASGFLSATVSAYYVLSEVADETFKTWWRQRRDRLSIPERELWNFMFGARGSEVHQLGPVRSRTARLTLSGRFAVAGQAESQPAAKEIREPEWSATPWRFEERRGRGEAEIAALAASFLALLGQIVDDFERDQQQ